MVAARTSPLGMTNVSCPLCPQGSPRARQCWQLRHPGTGKGCGKLSAIQQQTEFLFLCSPSHPLYLFCSSDSLVLMLRTHPHPGPPFPARGASHRVTEGPYPWDGN